MLMKVIGLMSGTSGDGVDAALVEIQGKELALQVKPLAFAPLPYPTALQRRILAASTGGTVSEICHLNALLGEVFSKAALRVIKKARLQPSDIHLIGSHGQTVHHLPKPIREPGLGVIRSTLQIAEPAVIAERTGITTVADFRPRDLAAGGQGAPLTPYAHYLLLRDPKRSRLIVNLGGISNVTYLPAGGGLDSIRAFDTGPGNMVLDALAHRLTRGQQSMDQGGKMAAKGTVDAQLLTLLLSHRFLRQRPPKSTGREEFGESFLAQVLAMKRRRHLAAYDLMATCSLFTAMAVGGARRWLKGRVDEVIVGGGGVRNRTLMVNLARVFNPIPVRTFEDLGWENKSFEAVAFALLAYQTIHAECANVPAATGAKHPVILGTIVPGNQRRQ
ncbi:MAG TPA: anhydro-N-acetylmuramic acid kinase, partial [Nitrospiraceae bacterium]|nr:anhydro-N-acetylmuramic acid kinase [Nitrospiraceae bacterium]